MDREYGDALLCGGFHEHFYKDLHRALAKYEPATDSERKLIGIMQEGMKFIGKDVGTEEISDVSRNLSRQSLGCSGSFFAFGDFLKNFFRKCGFTCKRASVENSIKSYIVRTGSAVTVGLSCVMICYGASFSVAPGA